jgi:hypothetical protein
VLFHLQTVFEGKTVNTAESGSKETDKYGIKVPVGYDAHIDGVPISTFMLHYGTGGTPWITVIDKKGIVRYNGFAPARAEDLAQLIDPLRG